MTKCKGFNTFKERGEWVELLFMSRAVRLGFKVSKPWGDSSAYDVGIESGTRVLRVQVKSTDYQRTNGYVCEFTTKRLCRPYTLKTVDFFAAYVIPKDLWYLIPANVVCGKKKTLTLAPENPRSIKRFKAEPYRETWELLKPPEQEEEKAPLLAKDARNGAPDSSGMTPTD